MNELRRITLLDEVAGRELTLPVMPSAYQWTHGVNMETVAINQLGDLVFPGGKKLHAETVECLLPANAYPFLEPGAGVNPFAYVEQLERWCDGRTVLRYIVAGTPLNAAVLIESVRYGEDDGSNDLTAAISLREYRRPEATVEAAGSSESAPARDAGTAVTEAGQYVVAPGDTLGAIARRFYGDAGLYGRLAAANGVKNPNLIRVGQVLTIPPADQLPAAAAPSVSQQVAKAATATWDEKFQRCELKTGKEQVLDILKNGVPINEDFFQQFHQR